MDKPTKDRLFDLRNRNMTIEDLAKKCNRSPVFVAAAITGKAQVNPEELNILSQYANFTECIYPPLRVNNPELEQDPFLYRLKEMVTVYGLPLKLVVNEKLGDGILSAIDCKVDVQYRKEGDSDRVTLAFDCKFLPYKHW